MDQGCSQHIVTTAFTTSTGILAIELDSGARYRGKADLKTSESDGKGGFHVRHWIAGGAAFLCPGSTLATYRIEHVDVGSTDEAIVRIV